MAKAANIKIKLLSSADTGFFYVTSKNSRTKTEKLSFRKLLFDNRFNGFCAFLQALLNKRGPVGQLAAVRGGHYVPAAGRPTPRTQEMRRT